jgi:adenylosuccinate synthase
MLLDVLSDLNELKICVAYELDGSRIDTFPGDSFLLTRCKPVYETIPGWKKDVSGVRKLADLPAGARRYVDLLAGTIGLPVSIVSVGPDRAQTIFAR